jgi:DNA-binding NtrC family response regulator
MVDIVERTRRLGASRTPVLITGETGTGKELIARALHQTSPWHESPFVALDCGALTENLAEAELFGHARGAFSGADRERQGLLRSAGDGTFFLDEIGNLAPSLQLKLLRALETGEVRPVGSDQVHAVRCRLVAASNSDLSRQMHDGRFRPDLFHRLQGGVIHLPPLRERMEDLDHLVEHFLIDLCAELDREKASLSPAAWHALQRHHWPGNVRELRMALQLALAMNSGQTLGIDDLPDLGAGHRREPARESAVNRPAEPVEERLQIPNALEGRMLLRVLAQHGWDKAASAREIGWSRQKLYRAMKNYGIPLRISDDRLHQIQEQAEDLLLPLDSAPEGHSTR